MPQETPDKVSEQLGETAISQDPDATYVDKPRPDEKAARARSSKPKPKPAGSPKETVVGDFRLIRKLGQGGMGSVFLAHQISLDRPCAFKVLSKRLAANQNFVERFIREARAMAKLDHPGVVKCFAVGEDGGHHYVAMEFVDGRSMQDWLEELGHLNVADALYAAIRCGEALGHAHDLKMIHRDVKPDNILISKKGVVKLSDLGLAKALDDDHSMTQTGHGLGTPLYMPPEQARNAKHVDERSDVYALGSTLYHLLTGEPPFSGDSVMALITAKEQGLFKPARRLNSEVTERLDLMLDKAMAKEPKYRYAKIGEFVADLESLHLAGHWLSFVEGAEKSGSASQPSPRAATPSQSATAQTPKRRNQPPHSEQRKTERPAEQGGEQLWFVRYADRSGRVKVSKMTTTEVLQRLKSDRLDSQAHVATSGKGPFLPVAQVPVFETETNRQLARNKAKRRETNLSSAYQQIEKQYNRRKWWRLLARFRDGTIGIASLILWLLLVAAALVAVIYFVPVVWELIAERYHLTGNGG